MATQVHLHRGREAAQSVPIRVRLQKGRFRQVHLGQISVIRSGVFVG